jgi:tRNA (guanosine-2'-O-)-methyltransferase
MHPNGTPEHSEVEYLIALMRNFITRERFLKFQNVLKNRTRHITVVLEDIFQPHNASAVLRSCDCFGIQDVHIIETRNKYEINPEVALGSSKWLNLYKYNDNSHNTQSCLSALKEKGYRIVATSPHQDDFTPENLPITSKTALIFGTELEGLTPAALSMADEYVRIPMVGFTESLNISVSAAILINALTSRLRDSEINWQLTEIESNEVLLQWLGCSINNSEKITKEALNRHRG